MHSRISTFFFLNTIGDKGDSDSRIIPTSSNCCKCFLTSSRSSGWIGLAQCLKGVTRYFQGLFCVWPYSYTQNPESELWDSWITKVEINNGLGLGFPLIHCLRLFLWGQLLILLTVMSSAVEFTVITGIADLSNSWCRTLSRAHWFLNMSYHPLEDFNEILPNIFCQCSHFFKVSLSN